jgi:hypothetical protein
VTAYSLVLLLVQSVQHAPSFHCNMHVGFAIGILSK